MVSDVLAPVPRSRRLGRVLGLVFERQGIEDVAVEWGHPANA